jgi:Pyruvate/2-oxoacid:ferredoxin oxidoreductase delta subunit
MSKRPVVQIDEAKCDGCGECVPSCEEGAIRIVDGRARLVSDVYCDGLGACLGHCPQGAITIVEREAADFDAAAARQHVAQANRSLDVLGQSSGCPATAVQAFTPARPSVAAGGVDLTGLTRAQGAENEETRSHLENWPVQLHLVPPQAPYLRNAELLLVADCVPFAYADFHRRFLHGRPVLIGCPKLDDGQAYVQKLAQIVRTALPKSITVLHMEVPCCSGLSRIAEAALTSCGIRVPLHDITITREGRIVENTPELVEARPRSTC